MCDDFKNINLPIYGDNEVYYQYVVVQELITHVMCYLGSFMLYVFTNV